MACHEADGAASRGGRNQPPVDREAILFMDIKWLRTTSAYKKKIRRSLLVNPMLLRTPA